MPIDDMHPVGLLTIEELMDYLAARLGADHAVICLWVDQGDVEDAWCVSMDHDFQTRINKTIKKIVNQLKESDDSE